MTSQERNMAVPMRPPGWLGLYAAYFGDESGENAPEVADDDEGGAETFVGTTVGEFLSGFEENVVKVCFE